MITCAEDKAAVLSTDPQGITARALAGALAILEIDFQEFLARLQALPSGDGAGN